MNLIDYIIIELFSQQKILQSTYRSRLTNKQINPLKAQEFLEANIDKLIETFLTFYFQNIN